VLNALLQKYQDQGPAVLGDIRVLSVPPLASMGTPVELVKSFGGREQFSQAVHELQSALYA
jgi:type I restriction enzyme R subunit